MICENKVGEHAGKNLYSYTLENGCGKVQVTNLGANIMSIQMPDKMGKLDDVVLGYDSVQEYFSNDASLGSTIGPAANRIRGGNFVVGGKEYNLPCNERGVNLLHSGSEAFSKKVWDSKIEGGSLILSYHRPDGEGGFPGNMMVWVKIQLLEDNTLVLEYSANSDKDTILNMTNHSYFNLRGKGSIEEHLLIIDAATYTPVNENLIPTGEIAVLSGTPLDFSKCVPIGERIDEEFEQLKLCGGYDHNYIIQGEGMRRAARVVDPLSERVLEVYTNKPAMQFYTANFLEDTVGKGGEVYTPRTAYCFETQLYPDGVHHENFPSWVLPAGQTHRDRTEFRFATL